MQRRRVEESRARVSLRIRSASIGLAIARRVARRKPGHSVGVKEKLNSNELNAEGQVFKHELHAGFFRFWAEVISQSDKIQVIYCHNVRPKRNKHRKNII